MREEKKPRRRWRKVKVVLVVILVIALGVAVKDWMLERRWEYLSEEPKILIYEMYPAAWRGGFAAMTEHLDRIAELEVDYVWLAPCYPSGGTDGGYDVVDYLSVDSHYGTMEDFDRFVDRADELGIKVVMDLVLNHTSDQHEWFKKSLQGEKPYDDYYLWSDEDLGWGTMFDGTSAFEWCEQRQQYYCHIYHKTQPDLNWNNPRVIQEFEKIIDFWTVEHGVSGFRVDSAQLIGKNFTKTWLPRNILGTTAGLLKYYQIDQTPEVLETLLAGRGLFTFGEMTAPTKGMFSEMVTPDGPLTAGLNLAASNAYDKVMGFIDVSHSLNRLERNLNNWAKNPSFIAMLESHDVPRFTSRAGVTGEEALGLLFGSKARIICLYQGQELGLENPDLGDDIAKYKDIQTIMRYEKAVQRGEDPQKAMAKLKLESRDNARAPLDLEEYSKQENDTGSCLNYAKQQIKVWKGE